MNPADKTSTNPWDWMQPHDAKMMGEVILDPAEQARWCRAVMLGGLPYMWRKKAKVVREMMYQRLALRPGDKVLILGESIESCGFVEDIREFAGPNSEITTIDITDEARAAYFSGKRGRGGQLATWSFMDYTSNFADQHFDCVTCLQGVQHTDDWRETAIELLRIMKPGRNVLLAEITFSPEMQMKAELDMHLEYWIEKLFTGVGFTTDQFPYYSTKDLLAAFKGLVSNADTFSWKGVDLFWGTKPGEG